MKVRVVCCLVYEGAVVKGFEVSPCALLRGVVINFRGRIHALVEEQLPYQQVGALSVQGHPQVHRLGGRLGLSWRASIAETGEQVRRTVEVFFCQAYFIPLNFLTYSVAGYFSTSHKIQPASGRREGK